MKIIITKKHVLITIIISVIFFCLIAINYKLNKLTHDLDTTNNRISKYHPYKYKKGDLFKSLEDEY